MKTKPCCVEIRDWLRANLGCFCLAPLTGTSDRALSAAVHLLDLYTYHRQPEILDAFAILVHSCTTHDGERRLFYHAIAQQMNWSDRDAIWNRLDSSLTDWREVKLPPISEPGVCAFEPGGCGRDLSKERQIR